MNRETGRRRIGYLGAVIFMFGGLTVTQSSCSSSGPATPATTAAQKQPDAASTAAAPASAATPAPASAEAASEQAPAGDQSPHLCEGKRFCVENAQFAAIVTDFRTSVAGAFHLIDVVVKFENKRTKTLTLGYMAASGIAVDEKGNRYGVGGPNGLRGIGQIAGGGIDPKFAIEPGSSADARFELSGMPNPVGVIFQLDFSVSEIKGDGTQHTVGMEFPLTFRELTNQLAPPDKKP